MRLFIMIVMTCTIEAMEIDLSQVELPKRVSSALERFEAELQEADSEYAEAVMAAKERAIKSLERERDRTDDTLQALAIKKRLEELETTVALDFHGNLITTTQIPDDAVSFKGGCYKLFPDKLTWEDAGRFCESLGGRLMSIPSQDHQDLAFRLLQESGCQDCFLGGSDDEIEGHWKWPSGLPVTYTNWAPGEPNNAGNRENRLQMYGNGTWNDSTDTHATAFICEWAASSQ